MFNKLENLVVKILRKDVESRNSDNKLYIAVIDSIVPNGSQMPVAELFLNQKKLGIPPYESVSRCRRRVQSDCPELRGNDEIMNARRKKEKQFKDYYLWR